MATAVRPVTPGESAGEGDDKLLAALVEAVGVLEEVGRGSGQIAAKAQALVAQRREGRRWDEILCAEEVPRLTALLSDSSEAIGRVNSRVRRAQTDVLYEQGLAMHRIGELLGITRQRVAVLLNAVGDEKGKVGETPR
ncbi:MAG TPA: hypothetical protein VG076_15770 [Acidimicrobiales bacterium]|jgi:hypothetical protein|nr:hypothetical protein [Acidimicrobiales bacterium]